MKSINQLYTVILLLFIAITTNACQDMQAKSNNNVISLNIGPFTTAQIEGGYEVILKQGEKETIDIDAPEDKMDKIKTEVANGCLKIWTEGGVQLAKVKITLTVKNIDALRINGGVNLKTPETLKIENFKLTVAGGAAIELLLEGKSFNMEVSGGTSVELAGKVAKAELQLNGAGNLNADKFECDTVLVDITGAGHADVFATNVLKARISGVGAIEYKGNPSNIEKIITGIGVIERKD
jgi:hypothetical protein